MYYCRDPRVDAADDPENTVYKRRSKILGRRSFLGNQISRPSPSTGQPSTTVVTPSGDDDDIGSREAKVAEADMEADNGDIHAIDAVLVPDDLRSELRDMKGRGLSPRGTSVQAVVLTDK